jgi:hypothetical protein
MDYEKHYNSLISRSKNRSHLGYTEKHHIIPKCIGGTDETSNIAILTPEEHYTAHLLLVKIYPGVDSLVYAANKMTVGSKFVVRNNKAYGWLKRKYQQVCRKRIAGKNPSYGKPWYHDPVTNKNGKFAPGFQPSGWVKGRTPPYSTTCVLCNQKTGKVKAKWCVSCKPKKEIQVVKAERKKYYYTSQEKLEALRNNNWHIRRALYSLGLSDSGYHYTQMRKIKSASMPPDFESGES